MKHRRIPHPRPWCCYSRLGKAKPSYATKEQAQQRADWAQKHYGDELEVYPCSVHAGRWHVRKARPAEKKELVGA